jgi:hypothetical protein
MHVSIAMSKFQSTRSDQAWKSCKYGALSGRNPPKALLQMLQIEQYYWLLTVV